MKELTLLLRHEQATRDIAAQIASICAHPCIIYLQGELGAGKTTFCRGFLRALGVEGAIKSPTYTLVEPYETKTGKVFHFDLYRLSDSDELEYIGLRDYLESDAICLFEWPERGQPSLPKPDLNLKFEMLGDGRELTIQAFTPIGMNVLAGLN